MNDDHASLWSGLVHDEIKRVHRSFQVDAALHELPGRELPAGMLLKVVRKLGLAVQMGENQPD
jgi:hypothetical protein